ncbi:MAG: tripartite tricarboxylate transporter substrate binding protein [Deltaproteobacteria bacterium]
MKSWKPRSLRIIGAVILFALFLPLATAVAAEEAYPTKPVRLIIPFPPGGTNDILGRLLGTKLSERLGKQFIADNRSGAGGLLGMEVAAKSQPDGYTLLIIPATYTVQLALYKTPFKSSDLIPVAGLGSGPLMLATNPAVPANSLKELIALAKKQPGKLICAVGGVGTSTHVGSELFKSMAGIDVEIVQFKGGNPAMIDVMGGHSQMTLGPIMTLMPQIKAGKLRAMGVSGKKRTPILPDVPAIAEVVPQFEVNNWWGIVAPKGTPKPIIDRLNKELAVVLGMPDVKKLFETQGAEAGLTSPAEFGALIESEIHKWGDVIKRYNIQAEPPE